MNLNCYAFFHTQLGYVCDPSGINLLFNTNCYPFSYWNNFEYYQWRCNLKEIPQNQSKSNSAINTGLSNHAS